MAHPEVLIVGAGPTGLVLALVLRINNIPVRIIDKALGERRGQRGAGLMPRTLELFHILGIHRQVLEDARITPPMKVYELYSGIRDGQTFDLNVQKDPTPGAPYMNILLLGQEALEGILRKELATKYDCHVEDNTELVALKEEEGRVRVKLLVEGVGEICSYPWVGGTDGARGVVRKQLGATFLGETPNVDDILVGDIMIHGLDERHWHMWGDAKTTLISLRPTDTPHLFSYILSGKDIKHEDHTCGDDTIREIIYSKTNTRAELEIGKTTWRSTYRPNIRMVNKLGAGRVFLAGDSAHVHSFTGGQGTNTGIQDAFNLGWKLALTCKRSSPQSLLRTYGEERLPVIAEMLSQTTVLLQQRYRDGEKPSTWKGKASLNQLGVNYRWSSIIHDEQHSSEDDAFVEDYLDGLSLEDGEKHDHDSYGIRNDLSGIKAGDRAPDATSLLNLITGQTVQLLDLFGADHHTVLIFADDFKAYRPALRAISLFPRSTIRSVLIMPPTKTPPIIEADYILRDCQLHAYDGYAVHEGCNIVIVRPDGMVGAVVRAEEGLKHYFSRIFCA